MYTLLVAELYRTIIKTDLNSVVAASRDPMIPTSWYHTVI